MQDSIWFMLILIAIVAIAGAIGGIVNALLTDNGFLRSKWEHTPSGARIWRPGFIGNVIIGAVAAVVSWGLYGPLSTYFVVGTDAAMKANASPENVGLSLASVVGGVLVGVGGARWLSNEVDKSLLRAAAVQAAGKESSTDASQEISMLSPAQAFNVTKRMK